jgi:hypothetical protein
LQISRKEQAAGGAAHASHPASAALDHRPVAQAKAAVASAAKSESFSFVCAWKDVPEIQRLFAACAASHVGGFQVQRGRVDLRHVVFVSNFSQSQFQPLRQRDAEVTLEQWMLFCRECSLSFHLNLSNSELQHSFYDARCGIQQNAVPPQLAGSRVALDVSQFTQCLVFVVCSNAPNI